MTVHPLQGLPVLSTDAQIVLLEREKFYFSGYTSLAAVQTETHKAFLDTCGWTERQHLPPGIQRGQAVLGDLAFFGKDH